MSNCFGSAAAAVYSFVVHRDACLVHLCYRNFAVPVVVPLDDPFHDQRCDALADDRGLHDIHDVHDHRDFRDRRESHGVRDYLDGRLVLRDDLLDGIDCLVVRAQISTLCWEWFCQCSLDSPPGVDSFDGRWA